MRRVSLGIGALLLLTLVGHSAAQAPDAVQQNLLGTWTGWVVEGRGERPDRGPAKISEMVITRDLIRARDDRQSYGAGQYRLDARQNPGHLDAMGTEGQSRGKNYLGIFSLQGDTLYWCSANPGRPRPTELATRPGNGQFLMVLKRVRK